MDERTTSSIFLYPFQNVDVNILSVGIHATDHHMDNDDDCDGDEDDNVQRGCLQNADLASHKFGRSSLWQIWFQVSNDVSPQAYLKCFNA